MATELGSAAEKLSQLDINGDWVASAPNLQKNLPILSSDQIELAKMLLEMGQSHLFEHWPEPGVDDGEKKSFFDQCVHNGFLSVGFERNKNVLVEKWL